jgi:hypothetical protein
VVECQVDDTVGVGSCFGVALEVVEIASPHLSAVTADRCRSVVGSGKADDVVSGFDKLRNDRRSEMSGGAGDEYAHGNSY